MLHTVRAAFAAFALLVLPQCVFAGPISWGYQTKGPDGTVLENVTGLTDLAWSYPIMPNPRDYGTPIPDPNPDSGLESYVKRTEATVVLTDEKSGQSATFGFFYEYWEQYEVNPDGSRDAIWAGYHSGFLGDLTDAPWQGVPFVLGGNTYTVRNLDGELNVRIEPGQTAATPEPGTLALAALGMCGLGVVRRIRRT